MEQLQSFREQLQGPGGRVGKGRGTEGAEEKERGPEEERKVQKEKKEDGKACL